MIKTLVLLLFAAQLFSQDSLKTTNFAWQPDPNTRVNGVSLGVFSFPIAAPRNSGKVVINGLNIEPLGLGVQELFFLKHLIQNSQ